MRGRGGAFSQHEGSLQARDLLGARPFAEQQVDAVDALAQHPNGLRTISTAMVEVRKAGLSSQVADVSVCGAVAPYNSLLGGKLVALLMALGQSMTATQGFEMFFM